MSLPPDASALLRSISLFEGLSVEDLRELADSLERRPFAAGVSVFEQGDRGDAM